MVGKTVDETVGFEPVQFRSIYQGMVYGMPDGNHLVFSNGQFLTTTEAEYKFLTTHSDFGNNLFIVK